MLKIAIVGCGQIGSRHLQSLALLEEPAQIAIFDPSAESLRVANERFHEVIGDRIETGFSLVGSTDIGQMPVDPDVAIIATGAAHRAEVAVALLEKVRPRFLIMEKFLFQMESDFDRIGNLLQKLAIPCFVNQWVSSLFTFQRIASRLGPGPYEMEIAGPGWGLCCNAAHFIEYFDFLCGREPMNLVASDFTEVTPAKRSGYYELSGSMSFSTSSGSRLLLECPPGESVSLVPVKMKSPSNCVSFSFGLDKVDCSWADGSRETYCIPMQSRLTHRFVEDLMLGGECTLPDFDRSRRQHRLLLKPFLDYFRTVDPALGDTCPIT